MELFSKRDRFRRKRKTATVRTKLGKFDAKRSATTLTITQSPIWQNWIPIENLGPSNLRDAPVLADDGDRTTTGCSAATAAENRAGRKARRRPPQPAVRAPRLPPWMASTCPAPDDSVSEPVQCSRRTQARQGRIPRLAEPRHDQLGAPRSGDRRDSRNGSPARSMIDGVAHIYYDFPNDQDPHVYVDRRPHRRRAR